MLRVPGSHNWECVKRNNNSLGPTTEVKIIQKWDGNRPAINWLLRDFRRYLIQEKIDNNAFERKRTILSPTAKTASTKRIWIEILLETPIGDYRKEAIRLIIAPYLINIKKTATDRLAINWLLRDFRRYLIQEKIDNNIAARKRSRLSPTAKAASTKRMWIEILLETPIGDYRKEAIRLIIAPYLINIRKLAYDDAFNAANDWLNRCHKVKPLDFNANIKIRDELRAATRVGYLPMAFDDLKSENQEVYRHISNRFRGRHFA